MTGESFTQNVIEDATANPDGPRNSDCRPPQTTGAEDTSGDAPERPDDPARSGFQRGV